jgi:ABC-type glycerol-3-phosphate transport system substrate-binding protein
MRSLKTAAVLTAVSAVLLTACGSDAGDEENDGPVELTAWFTQEEGTPSFDAFTEETGVEVKVDIVPADDVFTQLQRLEDAGQDLPDVIRFDGFLKAGLYESDLLRPIDDLIERWQEEDPDSFSRLPDTVFSAAEWDGKTLGMTYDASMDQLYYRTDWFRDAGIEVPWRPETQDEVIDAARQVADAHPEAVPFGLWGARGDGANFLITHMSAAGVPFEGAIPQLNTEAGLYVIEWYQTLVREGLVSEDILAWGEDEAIGSFTGGKSALTIESIGLANDLKPIEDMKFDEQWRLALWPLSRQGEAPEGKYVVNPWTFGITTGSEHPYEASLILRFLAEDEQVLEVTKDNVVRHNTVFEGDVLSELYPALEKPAIEALRAADGFPTDTNFFRVQDVLEQLIQDMLSNPDVAPDEIAAKWQEQLNATKS